MANVGFDKILKTIFLLLVAIFAILYAITPKSRIPERYRKTEEQAVKRPEKQTEVATKKEPTAKVAKQEPRRDAAIQRTAQTTLTLEEIKVCRGIIGKQPMGTASVFPDTIGRIFCYTVVSGADGPGKIAHVWFHGNDKLAEVSLDIQTGNWRTWSSKRIIPQWTGHWRVEVLDESGLLVGKKAFEVKAGK